MDYVIITDSAANIPTELAQKHGIEIIPFSYFIDGKEHICKDTAKWSCHNYYQKIRDGARVTTSQINPQKYIDFFTPCLKKGKNILFVGLSSGVSGSFASAQIAQKQLLEEFPDRKLVLIDSLGASMGEGLLALRAAVLRKEGFSLRTVKEELLRARDRMFQVFTVDDLMHLKRGGRLSGISAGIGTVLNIKPILTGNAQGKIIAFSKVRGRKKAIEALAAKYEELVENQAVQTVAISQADCPEDAAYLASVIAKSKPPKDIITVDFEPVTGSYVGPGTLALFFLSHDNVRLK